MKTCLRELESKLGGQRFDDDEDQVAAEGDGKAAAPGAAPEECICVDMEFTEKYEIVHKVEIQSERYGTMNMHCVTAADPSRLAASRRKRGIQYRWRPLALMQSLFKFKAQSGATTHVGDVRARPWQGSMGAPWD